MRFLVQEQLKKGHKAAMLRRDEENFTPEV